MSPLSLSRRRVPALWFVQDAARGGRLPDRRGPFTRAAVLEMWARGELGGDVAVWTNEKIFPDAARPSSSRPVRIAEWRRWAELPDPVRRRLERDALAAAAAGRPADRDAADDLPRFDAQFDPYSAANSMPASPAPATPPPPPAPEMHGNHI